MAQLSSDDVERLERRARTALEAGRGGDTMRSALDQLVADRTNGEPLETAAQLLWDALGEAEHPRRDDR